MPPSEPPLDTNPPHAGAGDTKLEPSRPDQEKPEPSTLDELLGRHTFSEIIPLADFAQRFVSGEKLWQALVEAIRHVLDLAPIDGPPRGLIVAEDPLLGLAAAQLFASPGIGVPLERNALRNVSRLRKAVAMHGELREFVHAARDLASDGSPLLMLGWNSASLKLAEAALAEAERRPALAGGLIWLVHKDRVATDMGAALWGAVPALPVLADVVSCASDILRETLMRLELPVFIDVSTKQRVDELIIALLRTERLSQLFDALNTPAHGAFQRLVSRLKLSEYPIESKVFDDEVLGDREDRPRHAASLFLVSHFPDLTPEQFVELGDSMAGCAQSFQSGPRWRRPPAVITDVVLLKCGINFIKMANGQATAVLGSGIDEMGSDPLGMLAAAHMRQQFDLRAPLLKERYLRHLDAEWTLGHASEKIASHYLELVATSLRADICAARQVPGERLRRIVYGPVLEGGDGSPDAANRRLMMLTNAIFRAPELIEACVGADSDERLHEVVASLCDAGLFPSERDAQPLIRHASASVFWLVYAHYQGRLSLDGFPSLFSQHRADDAQRRLDCLNQLRRLIALGQRNAPTSDDQSPWLLKSPEFLARLLGDIALAYPRIVGNGQEWVDVALLAEVGCAYLRLALRHATWPEVATWDFAAVMAATALAAEGEPQQTEVVDLALAKAMLSGRLQHWLLHPKLRPRESDGSDPLTPERTPMDEGLMQRRLVHAVLDALVGLRSFGSSESAAINIWFRSALQQPVEAVYFIQFSNDRYWQQLCTDRVEPDEAQTLLHKALTPVLQLFPMLLLMAATRAADALEGQRVGFRFSAALRDWLRTRPREDQPSPAETLIERVEQGLELQKQWQRSHDEVWLTADNDWEDIAAAMHDRADALDAFAKALVPIAQDSRTVRPVGSPDTLSAR